MQMILPLLLGVAATLAAPQERWVNQYDQILDFKCQNHQSIGLIISEHNNKQEDRVWDFFCKDTFSNPAMCTWTNYVNNFDEEFSFSCPFGSVLSGMYSYHEDKYEDRRWRFYCCQGEEPVSHNCKWSGFVNNFDEYLKWQAPANHYLTGAHSYHDNKKEDRRWEYQSCERNPV